MKTNRDLFMERLQSASTEDFISLLQYGKCSRCSNNYWDGTQARCHKNINDSTCELGYKEWLESYPEENLQEKYHKKYWHFKDYISAYLGKELMNILYVSGAVASPLETENICKEKCYNAKSCTGTECHMYYQHIINLYNKHIEDIKRPFDFETFLSDVLIPKIQDKLLRGKAEQILSFRKKYAQKP